MGRLKLQQEERLRLERQKQEERIKQEKQKKEEERQKMMMVAEKQFESKTDMKKSFRAVSASPQVTRRSDDVHGYGFGQVKTGHVMSTKISFFNKAASVEREISDTPEPKRRVVRFQGVDSPSLSPVQKPVIKTGDVAATVRGWTRKVKDHESQMQRQSPITLQVLLYLLLLPWTHFTHLDSVHQVMLLITLKALTYKINNPKYEPH